MEHRGMVGSGIYEYGIDPFPLMAGYPLHGGVVVFCASDAGRPPCHENILEGETETPCETFLSLYFFMDFPERVLTYVLVVERR